MPNACLNADACLSASLADSFAEMRWDTMTGMLFVHLTAQRYVCEKAFAL